MTVEGDNGNPGSQHKIYNSNITSKKKTTKCLGKKKIINIKSFLNFGCKRKKFNGQGAIIAYHEKINSTIINRIYVYLYFQSIDTSQQ